MCAVFVLFFFPLCRSSWCPVSDGELVCINWTHKLCSIRIVVAQCAMHVKSEIYFCCVFCRLLSQKYFLCLFFPFPFLFSLKCESLQFGISISVFFVKLFRHFCVLASLMWIGECVCHRQKYMWRHNQFTHVFRLWLVCLKSTKARDTHALLNAEPKTEQSFMQNWKLNKRKFIVYRYRFPEESVCLCA